MSDQGLAGRSGIRPNRKRATRAGGAKSKIAAEAGTSHRDIEQDTDESYPAERPSATVIAFPAHRARPPAPPKPAPWEINLAIAMDCYDRLWSRELTFVLNLHDLAAAGRLHALTKRQEAWLAAIVCRLCGGDVYA